MKRRGGTSQLIALAAVGVAFGLVAGCSSSEGGTEDASGAATSAQVCRTKADISARYDAILSGGTCSDVAATTGTWKASLLFPNAPASIRNRYCTYQWSPVTVGKAPDPSVLLGTTDAFITPNCGAQETAKCSAKTCAMGTMDLAAPQVIVAEPINEAGGRGGANGCDVCAVEEEGEVYVVLPPEADYSHMDVMYENGEAATLAFERPGGLQSFVVDLPEPPAGLEYAGAVRLW